LYKLLKTFVIIGLDGQTKQKAPNTLHPYRNPGMQGQCVGDIANTLLE
jgi:hypothetical protein